MKLNFKRRGAQQCHGSVEGTITFFPCCYYGTSLYGWCINHENRWVWALYQGSTRLLPKSNEVKMIIKKREYVIICFFIILIQKYYDRKGTYLISEPVRIYSTFGDPVIFPSVDSSPLTNDYSDVCVRGKLKEYIISIDSIIIIITVTYLVLFTAYFIRIIIMITKSFYGSMILFLSLCFLQPKLICSIKFLRLHKINFILLVLYWAEITPMMI